MYGGKCLVYVCMHINIDVHIYAGNHALICISVPEYIYACMFVGM